MTKKNSKPFKVILGRPVANADLLQFPKSGSEQISQRDLELFHLLRTQLFDARGEYREIWQKLTRQLREGAIHEPGIHRARLRTVTRAGKEITVLQVR